VRLNHFSDLEGPLTQMCHFCHQSYVSYGVSSINVISSNDVKAVTHQIVSFYDLPVVAEEYFRKITRDAKSVFG